MKKLVLAVLAAAMLSGCILINVDEVDDGYDAYDAYIPPPSNEPLEARTR